MHQFMKIILGFLILSLLTFSCKEKNEPQNKQEKITKSPIEVNVINQNTVKRNILNQVRSFEFLALKGIPVDKSILKVNKAIEYNGKLLLLDKMRSNLHLFTLDGDFIKIIGVKGDGPEEFKSIKDFSVHKNRNEIIIIDHESMLIYDLNGNFKNKVYLGSNLSPNSLSILDDDHIAFNVRVDSNEYYKILITDIHGNVKGKAAKFPEAGKYLNFEFTGGMNGDGLDTYYNAPTSSLVYKIIPPADLLPLYQLNFGTNTWPENKKYYHQEFDKEIMNLNTSYLNHSYKITTGWFIFSYTDKNRNLYGYYNINNQQVYTSNNINNSQRLIRFLLPVPIGLDSKNRFINSIEFETFLSFKRNGNGEFMKDLKNFNLDLFHELDKMNYDNSIILTFYQLK
ncbi:hypothetical protein Cycma_2010 [Cyclobacterium marinum DSM 745]|uniref:6-bladed beta-propeller n=2 Tax=Cyclobacterium marinum TaxID=104 RepID=G0IZU3_CYCMS|nr:hypothetical protein Cycma_2010 [Cyclobacterium marinum DSM 745]